MRTAVFSPGLGLATLCHGQKRRWIQEPKKWHSSKKTLFFSKKVGQDRKCPKNGSGLSGGLSGQEKQ